MKLEQIMAQELIVRIKEDYNGYSRRIDQAV